MRESGEKLIVTGVNFRKTALEIRNKFALTTENIRHIYEDREGRKPLNFFIISTCNRTEIYSIADRPELVTELFYSSSHSNEAEAAPYLFVKEGDEAIKHLFHVAAGLDSQIIGDHEIIGQLKNAFALAKSCNCTGGIMEKLVNEALQASRQVRNNTSISDGTTSISYAVIQSLKQELGNQANVSICLLGLGKIGTLTLKNLKHYLPNQNITLINRNELKAKSAADEFKVAFAKPEQQDEVLRQSQVLIVATGADHPIVTKQEIESSGVRLIFDLSLPSNISGDIKEIEGLKIFNIDQLSQVVNKTIRHREIQIPVAEKILEQHFAGYKEWERRREEYIANI